MRARAYSWCAHFAAVSCSLLARAAETPPVPARSPTPAALEFRQRVYARDQGLSDNRILSLLQSRDGYLWIGTASGLARFDGMHLLSEPHTALASFVVEDVHNADLSHLLSEQGIAVRAGQHCAMPLLRRLGMPGAVRVSLGLYSEGDDLERFFAALNHALELLR